jgi:hypothetical protein
MVSYNWDKGRMVGHITAINPVDNSVISQECNMANRISTRVIYNYKPIHGLNRWNDGVAHLAPEFEWTIAFPATSPIVRLLRTLQLAGTPFEFTVKDANNSGEYGLMEETFGDCRVEERRVNVIVDDVPAIVYSGMALRFDPKVMDADGNDVGYMNANFGSGEPLSNAQASKLFAEWTGFTG